MKKNLNEIIIKKNKGGGQVAKCLKNATFWADRNFWPMGPEGTKIGRVTILTILYTQLQGIVISIKNKKVMLIESYVMPKNQKSWLPPLWHSMSKLEATDPTQNCAGKEKKEDFWEKEGLVTMVKLMFLLSHKYFRSLKSFSELFQNCSAKYIWHFLKFSLNFCNSIVP